MVNLKRKVRVMYARTIKRASGRKVLSVFVTAALLITMFLPLPQPAEAAPSPAFPPVNKDSVVDGRILPAALVGDTSDWVEIAQRGDSSLIVRKNALPLGQVVFDTRNISAYNISSVRDLVNNWFKNTLPKDARVRNFTVKSTAVDMTVAGSLGYFANISAGFSQPTDIRARTGDDVAFLLSFAEAAMFCSNRYATSSTTATDSPALAKKNFNKLTPPGPASGLGDFWWLRSEGHLAGSTKNACSVGTHASPYLSGCVYASSSQAAYPYVRPALWISSVVIETWGTVNVVGIDADNPDVVLYSKSYTVGEGSYGPYGPDDVRFFLPGELAPDSDPISGTLWGGDEINIKYLHTRGEAYITIIHYDLWNVWEIDRVDLTVPAGPYGPIDPWGIPDYDPAILIDSNADLVGEIDVGEHLWFMFGYGKAAFTIIVRHEEVGAGAFWVDEFEMPLGSYGPYEPFDIPGYTAYWDDTTDLVSGECWIPGSTIIIRFFYEPIP